MTKSQHVTSVRLPDSVYEIALQKSVDMGASLSAIIREVIIDGLMPGNEGEHDKIRCYGASRTKVAIETYAKKKESNT